MIPVLILSGLVLLYFGAEGLVRGAVLIARRLRVSSLLIGLTVVAYGTSAPELVVSLLSGLAGKGDIAVGNVVGSNSFNIAVILGIAALVYPLRIHARVLRRDLPIMVGVAGVGALLVADGRLGRIEGVLLLAGIVAYTALEIVWARREGAAGGGDDTAGPAPPLGRGIVFAVAGLGVLVAGSRLLTEGAVRLATQLGVSEAVIGLTIVAAGTSLPELATSVVAGVRRQPDLAVGNIVGSNVFNVLCILGTASVVRPLDCPGIAPRDLGAMLVFSLALLPLMRTGLRLNRVEGALLLAGYGVYLFLLWPRN